MTPSGGVTAKNSGLVASAVSRAAGIRLANAAVSLERNARRDSRAPADAIGINLLDQAGRHIGIIMHEFAEALRAGEFHAVDLGAHVNRRAVLDRAQLTEPVEVLQRQTRRVAAPVADRATFIGHVVEQARAHRAIVDRLHFREIHIGRRIGRRLAHEDLVDLDAARVGDERPDARTATGK